MQNNQFDPSVPVTAYDVTAAAAIERLTTLIEGPYLTLTFKGGGMPDDGVTLEPREMLVVSREEIARVICLLRALPEHSVGIIEQEGPE